MRRCGGAIRIEIKGTSSPTPDQTAGEDKRPDHSRYARQIAQCTCSLRGSLRQRRPTALSFGLYYRFD